MKQIVPFTKKISFSTNVEEITSISLDKMVRSFKDNEISGEFELYLEYKENDISVTTESYTSNIPFDINLDSRYKLDDIKVEIDDFYYEIEDNDVFLHIDVLIDGLEYEEDELINIIPKRVKEEQINDEVIEDDVIDIVEDRDIEDVDDLFKEMEEEAIPLEIPINEPKKSMPIFETFDPSNETYVTYNVHIVRDEDNIDSICEKYAVTKEELSYYNEIKEIKLGDKLIVPTHKK